MTPSAIHPIQWVCDDLYIFFFQLITSITIPAQYQWKVWEAERGKYLHHYSTLTINRARRGVTHGSGLLLGQYRIHKVNESSNIAL